MFKKKNQEKQVAESQALVQNKKQLSASKMADNKAQKKAKKTIEKRNWYQDRYTIVVIQRNFLFLLVVAATLAIFGGMLYINQISQNKSIEPFIVEIEEKTGIPTVVDQVSIKEFTADEVIQQYFIYTYVRAREGYDYRTYSYDYHKVVRLFSNAVIYRNFRNLVSTRNENSPVNLYERRIRLEVKIKSMQDIDGAKQIRILVKHLRGNSIVKEEHKIIYMQYQFANLNISLEERLINPLGFRVVEYRVNEDFVADR